MEELDGDLANDDANAVGIGLSEELAICSLLFGGEVQVRRSCQEVSISTDEAITSEGSSTSVIGRHCRAYELRGARDGKDGRWRHEASKGGRLAIRSLLCSSVNQLGR